MPVYFETVDLVRFRSLREVHLKLGRGMFVLLGANAQGKTNFLEALFLLARGFSPFHASDEELILFGEESALLSARLVEGGVPSLRQALLTRGGKREWRRDGKIERRRSPLPLSGFFPGDLALVDGEPKRRRDFVDDALSFIRPGFGEVLGNYEKVLARRNLLLREGGPRELVDAYGEQLVVLGAKIVEERLKYLKALSPFFLRTFELFLGERGGVRMEYRARGYEVGEGILEGLGRARKALEEEERGRGMTLFGPHRDEILFLFGDRDVREFASFGEKKSIALALRIAEKAVIQWIRREETVLLLDDAFPGLDRKKRGTLCALVTRESQVFLTTTEEDVALELSKEGARVLLVEEGKVQG
ncbi:MAG: DNA replication/repair protein RecF [Candidatus Caldatribacteriaceae bacterium]